MTKFKKSVTVPTIIFCTIGWAWFIGNAKHHAKELEEAENIKPTLNSHQIEQVFEPYQLDSKYKTIYNEYERLKKEEEENERNRLEELERQRLIKLEEERLAKIKAEEERKKRVELKRLEVEKKKKQQNNDYPTSDGNWINAELTHFTAYCKGCSGKSASGEWLRDSIYHENMRIVAATKSIPMYSILQVEYPNGESFKAIVLDRGGAISHKGILDVLVSSKSEAYKLGRQKGRYKILRYGKGE